MDRGFSKDAVFLDIGANVGMNTIWVTTTGVLTYAFEPGSRNHVIQNKNTVFNMLQDRVSAY